MDNNLNDINENIIIENDIESKNSSNDMESIINGVYELNINDEDNYKINNEVNEPNYNEMNYIIDNYNIDELKNSLSIIEIPDSKIEEDNNLNELKNNII